MPQLKNLIANLANNTPCSIDQFMQIALYDKNEGYYTTTLPMGDDISNSDFVTAPELSPVFAQTLALNIISKMQKLNITTINILELGPGKGTLAKDILKTLNKLTPSYTINYYLHEISPSLINKQEETLSEYNNINWINDLQKVNSINNFTNEKTIVLANEFFDALPIKQYKKINDKYHEVLVSYTDDKFRFSFDEEPSILNSMYDEEYVEIQQNVLDYIEPFKNINADFLIIDYGNLNTGNTLQALYKHKMIDIFEKIGQSDLTAHVDFRQITNLFNNSYTANISNMADFLTANGLLFIIEQLLQNADQSQTEYMNYVAKKLLHEEHMGKLFKVLEISSNI